MAIIYAVLARIPNLQKMAFTNHWEVLSDPIRVRPSPTKDYPIEDRYGGPFSRTYPDYAEKPIGRPITNCPNNSYYDFYIDYGFQVICRVLSITNTRLPALSIDYLPNNRNCLIIGIAVGSFNIGDRDLTYYYNAFRGLRKIEFSL